MINSLPKSLIESATSTIIESNVHDWNDRIGGSEIIDVSDRSKSPKEMNKLINDSKDQYVPKYAKLYHGTHPEHDILTQGLRPTTASTKRSMQSASGYVYLSTSPRHAKMFGDLAYGINNSKVYEVVVPTHNMLPDKDQLRNARMAKGDVVGSSIGDSIIHGGGVRVKGHIAPWQIKEHTTSINEAKKEEPVFDLDARKLPYVDISHHHPRKHLQEGHIIDWINKTQPFEHEVSSFTLSTNLVNQLSGPTYETPDQHQELADQHASNLSDHHYHSIDAYITGGLEDGHDSGSEYVNKHLINSHRSKKQPRKEFSFGEDPDFQKVLHLDHLDDALNKNKLDKQLTTYSGIGFHPKDLMKDDCLIHLPAYTSSSANRGVSLMYAKPDSDGIRHIMEIKHPKGSNGIYLGDNEDFTPFRQKEHIMPRNATIKVNPEPEVHMDNMGNKIHVWKARRVLRKEDKE